VTSEQGRPVPTDVVLFCCGISRVRYRQDATCGVGRSIIAALEKFERREQLLRDDSEEGPFLRREVQGVRSVAKPSQA